MKLTDEQRATLEKYKDDLEAFHSEYDEIIEERLNELDPEFIEDIRKQAENVPFWYA